MRYNDRNFTNYQEKQREWWSALETKPNKAKLRELRVKKLGI
jgi:hypothetical protein